MRQRSNGGKLLAARLTFGRHCHATTWFALFYSFFSNSDLFMFINREALDLRFFLFFVGYLPLFLFPINIFPMISSFCL